MNSRDIFPHSLSITETPSFSDGNAFDNYYLRFGEVQELVYPDEKESRSKKFIEYNVWVQHSGNGTGTGVLYSNCMLINSLAGLADECHFTLRAPKIPSLAMGKNKLPLGLGSKVFILCQNGEKSNAYIIGGQRDFKDELKDTKDLGHHFSWIFNGISAGIDKEGQLTITYNGKTDIDGKLNKDVKKEVTGSTIRFSKNGNISIADQDDRNQVLIDHENDRVVISASSGMVQLNDDGVNINTADGAMVNLDARDDKHGVSIHDPSGNVIALNEKGITAVDSSGSSVTMTGDGTIQVAGDAVVVTGSQVDIAGGSCTFGKDADSFMVRGTELKAILTALTTLLTTTFAGATVAPGGPLAASWAAGIAPIVVQINTLMLSMSNKVK